MCMRTCSYSYVYHVRGIQLRYYNIHKDLLYHLAKTGQLSANPIFGS